MLILSPLTNKPLQYAHVYQTFNQCHLNILSAAGSFILLAAKIQSMLNTSPQSSFEQINDEIKSLNYPTLLSRVLSLNRSNLAMRRYAQDLYFDPPNQEMELEAKKTLELCDHIFYSLSNLEQSLYKVYSLTILTFQDTYQTQQDLRSYS